MATQRGRQTDRKREETKKQGKAKGKKKGTCGSTVFSTGHPRQYSLAPAMLVCADRTRRGRFIAVWPQMCVRDCCRIVYLRNLRQSIFRADGEPTLSHAYLDCLAIVTIRKGACLMAQERRSRHGMLQWQATGRCALQWGLARLGWWITTELH